MNSLRIRDRRYFLPEVVLYLALFVRPESGLTFTLFADTDDQKQAGFAINCMSVPDAAGIDHLCFELNSSSTDQLNELGESVICQPGVVLELSSLRLTFGAVNYGYIPVTLEATAHTRQETCIPVRGDFDARVVWDEAPGGATGQPSLPL